MPEKIQSKITTARFQWIDWMKTIGIYFIVVGHFMPIGYIYIYIFSVPIFFLISGFLNKKNETSQMFFKKIYIELLVPMILLVLANILFDSALEVLKNHFSIKYLLMKISASILGFQSTGIYGSCLGVCWFIYTLILCKITHQFIDIKWQSYISIICIIGAYVLYENKIEFYNSYVNFLVSYPIFFIGTLLKHFKSGINKINILSPFNLLLFLSSFIVLYIIALFNPVPWMYKNGFGNDFTLFIMGSLSGCYIVFFISKLFSNWNPKFCTILSIGNIIILGLHPIFLNIIFIGGKFANYHAGSWIDYLISIIIMIIMYFIIIFCHKHLKILLGNRTIQKKSYNVKYEA